MLDLPLFRRPASAARPVAAFVLSASIFAMFLYLTLCVQNVLGYSPLQAGLRFLPITLALVRRRADLGQADPRVRSAGSCGRSRRRRRAPADGAASPWTGWTACCPASSSAASDRADEPGARDDRDRRRPAGALGHGVGHEHHVPAGRDRDRHRRLGGAIFQHHLTSTLGSAGHGVASGVVPPNLREQATAAFVSGMNELFLISAAIAAVGAVSSFFLIRRRDFYGRAGGH